MSLTNVPHLLRSLTAEPLVIERRTLDAFVRVLRQRHIDGTSFSGPDLHAELQIAEPREPRRESGKRTIQVVPIVGAISNRSMSMGTGALYTADRVKAAAADSRVDGIVLDIDSPGGTVMGVPELADAIYQARQQKPVKAVARGLMASAAYWAGAAADEVVMTPSSEAGSIGVIALHEDWSQWLENEGVAVSEYAMGEFKTEGAPWKAMTEEGSEFLQARVAEIYDWFVGDVARFRGASVDAVRGGYGRGRVLGAEQAIAAGLADRVGTLEGVIAEMVEDGDDGRVRAAAERRKRARARR